MQSIIIGSGEVGNSLYDVLESVYREDVLMRDILEPLLPIEDVKIINICYPYSEFFIEDTKAYIEQYKPEFTIIHSTVPVGTTRKCGKRCVHSPIHGKHPNLAEGIKTFVKYVGGENSSTTYIARCYLEKAGITTKGVSSPEASEMSKILCTTYYGWNIVFAKEVKAICDEFDLNFKEVYSNWNFFYNQGYSELGMPQFVRPVLEPVEGKIGGHCILNNTKLLDSFVTNFLREKDRDINMLKNLQKCHDCGAKPGEIHLDNCDVERCSACGGQRLQCDCKNHDKRFARWTGVWPGKAEADFLGLDLNEFEKQGYSGFFFIKPENKG